MSLDIVRLHLEAENRDSDVHPLPDKHDDTLTESSPQLHSTGNRKSNSTSSLNNLSLIL